MILIIKRFSLALFFLLLPAFSFASGWNDFSRDIGHGFELVKMNSFQVCIDLLERGGLIVCPDFDKGEFGPVSDFVFTDNHLLVRTHGAKPDTDLPGKFETDITKEYYFIIDKKINHPQYYQPTGPLSSEEFYDSSVVPADLNWERATRFASSTDDSFIISALASLIVIALAPFLILSWLFGWSLTFSILIVLLFFVALALFRRQRRGNIRK